MRSPLDLPGAGPATSADLAQLRLFKNVAGELLEEVFPHVRRTRHATRSTVLLHEEFKDRMGFVWSGHYRFVAVAPSQEMITLYRVGPRDSFGVAMMLGHLQFGDIHRLCVDRGGVLIDLPAEQFWRLKRQSDAFADNVSRAMVSLLLTYGARLYEQACADVRTRLQSELLRQARSRPGRDDRRELEPSLTHASLAALVGATREGVTRHLHALRDEGVIELNHGKITVVSMKTLQMLDAAALGRRFRSDASES